MNTHAELRSPAEVMPLSQLGSHHQSRLSFMRILLRRLKDENWRFEVREFAVDNAGVGHAVYTAHGPARSYSLVAFAHDLPAEKRSDRVIAEAWDCTFTLFDGIPTAADVQRLSENVPLQEAGRISETELSLARANRSGRMFGHVVDALAAGQQPDQDMITSIGYIMRTTAVYGSGKFGAADRAVVSDRPEFAEPFQVEMLHVFLIRAFVMDLVEHMAAVKSPNAVKIAPHLRRQFGIGNSTGLGMAPFLINHPELFNNWVLARETALMRVRNVAQADPAARDLFRHCTALATDRVGLWQSENPYQVEKLRKLRADVAALAAQLADNDLTGDYPWDGLYRWAKDALSPEGLELLVSLMLEPYGALVDDLASTMSSDEALGKRIDGAQTVAQIITQIENHCGWTLGQDWADPAATARAWYVSAEKLEPRLGERASEPIEPYEQPLAPARDVARFHSALSNWDGTDTLAAFLAANPEHRQSARRLQIICQCPYGEIYDNTVSADLLPVDMLRCKLAFFGATEFDPRSDRWVRINMFRGAPFPDDLANEDAGLWTYLPLGDAT